MHLCRGAEFTTRHRKDVFTNRPPDAVHGSHFGSHRNDEAMLTAERSTGVLIHLRRQSAEEALMTTVRVNTAAAVFEASAETCAPFHDVLWLTGRGMMPRLVHDDNRLLLLLDRRRMGVVTTLHLR